MSMEHVKYGYHDWGTGFIIVIVLNGIVLNLHLSNHISLLIPLDITVQEKLFTQPWAYIPIAKIAVTL